MPSNSFTDVFGGNTVFPSDVSYAHYTLTADLTLEWPLEASTGANVSARIIDVTAATSYSITMPPADQTSVGQVILFNGLGPATITVLDNDGGTLLSVVQGAQWEMYLTDNSTTAGTWRTFRFGAATADAQASALAGYGLIATGSTLSQDLPVTEFNSTYTVGLSNRAAILSWTGGAGTLDFISATTAGTGWFVSVRNSGSGDLILTPSSGETIDSASTKTLQPGDTCTVFSNGLDLGTLGFGQSVEFAFDYTSISLTGQSTPYTLSGAELNRVAYNFTGVLTANMVVVVPSTIQQYWVTNSTTGGSYTLSFRTSAQTPAVTVTRDARGIYYCDGSDFLDADTGGVSTPISVADGGTGATTANGALINLGGTSVGIAVFTAVDQAAAQAALGVDALSEETAIVFAVALG